MVIVLDKNKKPLGFVTERRFRILCEKHRACLYRAFPRVGIIMDVDAREIRDLPSYRIKIDPGSKHTGLAIVCNETNEVMYYQQIEHRGDEVKKSKDTQRNARRNRRTRETHYRKPGFKKGQSYTSTREDGWLPPSVKSTADNIINWVKRLSRWINITECSFEAVRFDTQLMDNPDIEGIEYQQGELFGYEIREYLLDKYGHTCQYCNSESGDPILEWEHKKPRSRKGSDSVKNATLSCRSCNEEKDTKTPDEWFEELGGEKMLAGLSQKTKSGKLTKKQSLLRARLEGIKNVIGDKNKTSDRYCAWVNSTRQYIEKALFEKFGDVECSSGGRTKYNRIQVLGLPKEHHYDALCVGNVPKEGYKDRTGGYVLLSKAMGRGTRLRGNLNECGIIVVKYKDNSKMVCGFQTGDIVTADIPKGKYAGHYTGRVSIRHRNSFGFKSFHDKKRFDVNYRYLTKLQCTDGYDYTYAKC